MLEFALGYLARGWSIVPGHVVGSYGCSCRRPDCDRPGKHPRVRWRELQERLPTEAEVRYWWRRWPESNIILITGKISNVVAVDVDPRHAGDEAWEAWTEHNVVPDTVRSLTGGGGTHYLFEWPGEEVHNRADMLPGVDFRGDGGFIVLPPSRHASGTRYDWDVLAHPEDAKLAKMPQVLVRLVQRQQAAMPGKRVNIDQYTETGKLIGEGSRNDTLARVAGRLVHSSDSMAELVLALEDVNEKQCVPPLGREEVRRIGESIWRREAEKKEQKRAADDNEEVEAIIEDVAVDNSTGELKDTSVVAKLFGLKLDVSDWFILRGATNEYVLVTPEDEIRLGPNLLNYDSIATRMFNETGQLMTGKKNWSVRATELRKIARQEFFEPLKAGDQVTEWLAEYIRRNGAHEVEASKYADRLAEGPLNVLGEVWIKPVRFSRFIESTFGEKVLVGELRKLLKRAGWAEGTLEGGVKAWHRVAPDAEDTSTEENA